MLDCRLSLSFEKLLLPPLTAQEYIFDLRYEDQHSRFKYPLEVPQIFPLNNAFTKNNKLHLIVLLRLGNKYKKIARGEINLYPKYFATDKLSIDKMIYLDLYETQLEQMGHSTNILKTLQSRGQVYMKAQLLDPLIESESLADRFKPKGLHDNITIYTAATHASAMTKMLKQNLKNIPLIKDKVNQIKTEKYRSITEHENDLLRKIRNNKAGIAEELFEDIEEEDVPKKEEFNDNLSDVSISIIDGTEEYHTDFDHMNIGLDILVDKLRTLAEDRIEELIPEEPAELKLFIEDMIGQTQNVSEIYVQNLRNLSEINNSLKFQAKDYYEKYKELKRNFDNERKELKTRNLTLEKLTKMNHDENQKVAVKLTEVKNELQYFKNKVGLEDDTLSNDEDMLIMLRILDSLQNEGVDLYEGLDQNERDSLLELLEKKQRIEPDSYPIIEKLDMIVNNLYLNEKKINNISIAETDDNDTFKFDERTVGLYIENDILKVREKGFTNFEDWVLFYFGKEKPKTNSKSNSNISSNGTKPTTNTSKQTALNNKKTSPISALISGSNTTRTKTPVKSGKK